MSFQVSNINVLTNPACVIVSIPLLNAFINMFENQLTHGRSRKTRSVAKGSFTRFANLFNSEVQAEEPDLDDVESTFQDVENA